MELDQIISRFGEETRRKLSSAAVTGAPEDQLRAPLEGLIAALGEATGLAREQIAMIGESTLAHLGIRPDYAVTVRGALVGFIEVKAPGKGADPRRFSDDHDKKQWTKLRSLPNLIYTDGQSFSLWRDGAIVGQVVQLNGDLASAGARLSAPPELLERVRDFLGWSPIPPQSPEKLAEVTARLCRLLRDEVQEELARQAPGLTSLAEEWKALLFPQATNEQFADGYAQAVTFGLLMARAQGITLANGIEAAASALRRTNTLIGTALRLLTDDPDNQKALATALQTLTRVLDAVDWPRLSRGKPEAWLYFYEQFLAVYDRKLRRLTGSYYTPPEVVDAMVRLTDEALRDPEIFNHPRGLAERDVTIVDPATGTGTFLLGILRRMAATIAEDQGEGAVGPALAEAARRLIGFELQFGPFAVAQLRLLAEIQALAGPGGGQGHNLPLPQLFVTDTLGDPFAQQTQFSSMVAAIGESRRQANEIKRQTPITVVIGNPPYKEKAKGLGGWVEAGSSGRDAPMALWTPPANWGVGAHAKHLKNLYVFFWRWATWKVFAPDLNATTGQPDEDRGGIVCFITVAGFLNGPGFQRMRAELRRDASEIWVIDCTPEGHQPEVATRIFEGVQQPVCIVLVARRQGKDRNIPARVRVRALAPGRRQDKFTELGAIQLDDGGWQTGPSDWRAPFLPQATGAWAAFPALEDFFVYNGSGVMPGRTWVIAPDQGSLAARWDRLIRERDAATKERLFHPHLRKDGPGDKHTQKAVQTALAGHPTSKGPIAAETDPHLRHFARYAFRTLDRQWIIPDNRCLNQPNPELWSAWSRSQVYLTALSRTAPSNGPALSFCGLVPDLDHYRGNFGGRVFPLWRDAAATVPNIKPALLADLSRRFARPVPPLDLMAYAAGLLAHPAFTARFRDDLRQPGLRVPLTADPALFDRAVRLGHEVIWLHTYGERCVDPAAGRPAGPPRLPRGQGPTIPAAGAIPGAPHPLPDDMSHDAATNRLSVGQGWIENVPQAVFDYEVSGKNVLRQWFSYRKADRSRPVIGDRRPPSPLDSIQPAHWLPEYTDDLLNLLHVLGRLVALEPVQATLLNDICSGPLIDAATLEAAGALTMPTPARTTPPRRRGRAAVGDLFE